MNSPTIARKPGSGIWLFLIGILFIGALAISNQSLWIDEANTAIKSQQATLHEWWKEMLRTRGSDMQMPLYMIWIWVCGKIFGSSEIALRGVNLFWFIPGMFLLWRSLARQPQLQRCVFWVALFSPFAWYYLDEARPYAMQMGASLALLAIIIHWNEDGFEHGSGGMLWAAAFAFGTLALCGASMLGVIWAGAAVLAVIFLLPKQRLFGLVRDFKLIWLAALIVLGALGVYYLWTLKSGARASDVGTTSWKNILFVAYELLGFAGLGPGRLDIRSGEVRVFKPYLIELVPFIVATLLVLLSAVRRLVEKDMRRNTFLLSLIISLPILVLFSAGFALHFRVLGRHFTPLFSVVVFILGQGLMALWQRPAYGKAVLISYLLLCLASCLALRFEIRHSRDDYRDAAGLANQTIARGERAWWDADGNGAKYYHLLVTTNDTVTNAAFLLANPSPKFLASTPEPAMVCCSRPDLYDGDGTLSSFLQGKGFQVSAKLPAFTIWTKPTGK